MGLAPSCESVRSIARHHRVPLQHVQRYFRQTGGIRPAPRCRSARHLSGAEREEISRGIAADESARVIAARLERAPATISREIARNGGREQYRARCADDAAYERGRRPKASLLAARPVLRARVEAGLDLEWSPQQIQPPPRGRLSRRCVDAGVARDDLSVDLSARP